MRTINQFINLYNSVLNGKTVELYGHKISSDSNNWIVDGIPTDTLKNKLITLNSIIEKCEIAKRIIKIVGLNESNMYNDYFIIFDSIDGMIMLVSNTKTKIQFIYIVSNSIIVEQINKKDSIMIYDLFNFDNQIVTHKTISGKLSEKSIRIIKQLDKKEQISITQNFFYDMLLEGMKSYSDFFNVITNKVEEFELKKLKNKSN